MVGSIQSLKEYKPRLNKTEKRTEKINKNTRVTFCLFVLYYFEKYS